MEEIYKQKIKDLIEENLTSQEISTRLNISRQTLHRKLKKFNLKTKKGSGGQNRIMNHNPFIDLDNPETQYWLGFLAADGYISASKYYFSCYQANDDRFHMILFRDFLCKDIKLVSCLNKNGNESMGFSTGNKEVHEFLNNLGLTSAKSRTLNYLGEITGHFIRGVFDGDGSCSTNNIPKITTSSPLFRDQLLNYFNENSIKCNYREKGDKNSINPIYDVQILSEGRINFYNLLYNNYNVCLERKRLKVFNILTLSRNKIG
jgi:hypothetical protein